MPEPEAGKDRTHLDIGAEDAEADVGRLQELGAGRLDEGVESMGTRWVRMSDPDGKIAIEAFIGIQGLLLLPAPRA